MLFLVMLCLIPLFFTFYFRWDWRLTRGPTVYRLALEFFFGLGTHKVSALGCSRLDLVQIGPDVLYIEKLRKLIYMFDLYNINNLKLL